MDYQPYYPAQFAHADIALSYQDQTYQAQAYQAPAWQRQYQAPAYPRWQETAQPANAYYPPAQPPPVPKAAAAQAPAPKVPAWDEADPYESEIFARLAETFEQSAESAATAITDQQLRALGKRHLILMLRDQEKLIEQLKREKNELLLAHLAGLRY